MWLLSGRCNSKARLDGKVAIVTGANCGIGKATALDFVRRGARVIIACRDLKKAEEAAADIRRDTKNTDGAGQLVVVKLDLASLASVRQCAQDLLRTERQIHILVNNAGAVYCPRSTTEDGFEIHIGVNHLGHFLFTCLLLPRIIRSAPARIVTVASVGNYVASDIHIDDLHWKKRRYNSFMAYCESKLANVLFSAELARRLEGTGVTTYSLHPGVVGTEAGRHVNTTWFPGAKWLFENVLTYFVKTCEQGAQTTIYCAVSEEAGKETGLYYRKQMWLLSGRCNSKARLGGKVAIVTGANCGIGKATALDFVRRGARVIIACRDLKKAEEAAADIRRDTKDTDGAGQLVVVKLDLASLASVRQCAQDLLRTERQIHILVNNAGAVYCPRSTTEDGFEMQIGVNHLGHFLFTCLLLPRIIRSAPARIITVASVKNYVASDIHIDDLHWKKRRYNSFMAYSESKLANVLFSAELARRLEGTGVTTYSLHPGVVGTEAFRHVNTTWFPGAKWLFEKVLAYFVKTCEQGAQTTIYCAVSEEAGKETGLYYSDCHKSTCNPKVNDKELLQKLWAESARHVGLGDWDPFAAEDNGELPPQQTQPGQD